MPLQPTKRVIDLLRHVQMVGSQAQVSGGHLAVGCAPLSIEISAEEHVAQPFQLAHKRWTVPQRGLRLCYVYTHCVEVSRAKRGRWLGSMSECCGPRAEICVNRFAQLGEPHGCPSTRTCLCSPPNV